MGSAFGHRRPEVAKPKNSLLENFWAAYGVEDVEPFLAAVDISTRVKTLLLIQNVLSEKYLKTSLADV